MAGELTSWKGQAVTPIADENAKLNVGDRIIIQFKWLFSGDWLRAYELSVIDKKLEGRSDFRVLSYANQGDYLYAEVEIVGDKMQVDPGSGETQQAGLGITAALVIAALAIAIYGIAHWGCKTFIYVRKEKLVVEGIAPPSILEEKPSVVAQIGTGFKAFGLAALVGVAAWFVLRWRRY